MQAIEKERCLEYPVISCGLEDCVSHVCQSVDNQDGPVTLVCLNPHSVGVARHDEYFAEALQAADMIVPDGAGILLASKILGGNINERITGTDIFLSVSETLNRNGGVKYFFLGSTKQTLGIINEKIAKDFPRIQLVGTYSPPFKEVFSEEDNRVMIDTVNATGPDVLWVGMTAPKQEKWIYANKDKLNVKFIAAIGAVFDFYAGNVKRSHPWFQTHGLEWLPRLIREPRRLWRRTFISAPLFLYMVLKHKLNNL